MRGHAAKECMDATGLLHGPSLPQMERDELQVNGRRPCFFPVSLPGPHSPAALALSHLTDSHPGSPPAHRPAAAAGPAPPCTLRLHSGTRLPRAGAAHKAP
eukprot:scaffold164259_cov19-Tisochrysis_lutea.AAC.1